MKKKQRSLTKTMLFPLLVLAFVLGVIPIIGNAQNGPNVFAIVDFMKVKPADEGKYLELEKNIWNPLHQARIDQGKITGWILYRVLYTGTNDPYNYVTITFFDNPANLEDPWSGIDPKKILSGKDTDKAFDETLKSRDLVTSQLIFRQDEALPEGGPVAIKYIQIDYMKVKPGNEGAYLDVEKNIWKPIHQEFIKAGSRAGWSLWNEVYPAGSGSDYQYITANYFSEFTKIGTADYNAAINKAHAGKDIDAMGVKTTNSRDLVRSELWQVLDSLWK